MQVDQSGNKHVMLEPDAIPRPIEQLRFGRRQQRNDSALVHRDAVIGERGPGGFDRNHPSRADEPVYRLHGCRDTTLESGRYVL